MHNHTWVCKCL